MSTAIKPGDKARIKATGEIFTVDDANPDWFAGPECDECYIEGTGPTGSVIIDSPDEIEKVDWTAPTPEDLAKALSSELHKWGDGIEVHETSDEGNELISVLARWNGVEGGFHVRFGQWQEDML